tara:strand:- start:12 stop:212 length:201 start_codon:yes stop_codon:yes gene_type:complete
MAWTKEHWDSFKKAPLDGPHYQAPKAMRSRLSTTQDQAIHIALEGLKHSQRDAGKKRKQKQSWNYG